MNRIVKVMLAAAVSVCCFSGCMPAGTTPPSEDIHLIQLEEPAADQEMAVVDTTAGVIKFVLYEDYAPNTVKQFKELVEEGFYENNPVFSVQKESSAFLAGASNEEGTEGKTTTENGKGLDAEVSTDVWHFSGAVSAYGDASGLLKNIKSDSRFFIVGSHAADTDTLTQLEENDYPQVVIDAYKKLGGMPAYTGRYTVFGQVVEGMDVVDSIIASSTEKNEEGQDTGVPAEEILINSITLTTYGEGMADTQTQESSTSAAE